MITDINSEDRLVQQTFADHLEKALGWGERLPIQDGGLQRHRHILRHHLALVCAARDSLLPCLMNRKVAV